MREGSESALPGGSETASATASRQAVPAGEALQAEDAAVERQQEDPVLSFTNYAVGFHFATSANASESGDRGASEEASGSLEARALESFERDMLLYAYRHVAPLKTRSLGPHQREPVAVTFPHELDLESEGEPIRLVCEGAHHGERVRHAIVLASRTSFARSDVAVMTLVLRSAGHDPSEFNEYDLIKLAKLWEGGERLPEPGSRDERRYPVRFEIDGRREPLTVLASRFLPPDCKFLDYHSEQLASAMRDPASETRARAEDPDVARHYRVGTIALRLPATRENRRLFADAQAVKELSDDVPGDGTRRWKRVRAVGGVMQGLLDFETIGPTELSDVFAGTDLEEDSLLAFHKGTLLSVALQGSPHDDAREADLARPIGISPYLVIPHAVLLYNEQRLKWALIRANELLRMQGGAGFAGRDLLLELPRRAARRPRGRAAEPPSGGSRRVSIEETEEGVREISQAAAQHLPNVFHYRSERELYERGSESRGFSDFEPLIRSRLKELEDKLAARVRQRDTWTFGLTLAFFAIAVLQLALKSAALWFSLLLLAGLAVLLWQVRKKVF